MRKLLILTVAFFSVSANVVGQKKIDTTYFTAFPNSIQYRLYFSQKFTGFKLFNENTSSIVRYQPRTTRNLGVGFTYKWATLNLAYGFGFLNDKGESSRYLDLQSHQYMKKINIDFYGQIYRGYESDDLSLNEEIFRSDVKVDEIGVVVQYNTNYDKFSFRAAFLNTEVQKKSAGTFLFGGNIFWGRIRADSSLVPEITIDNFAPENYSFFKVGPLAGYAYTLVIKEKFFIASALTIALNYGRYSIEDLNRNPEDDFFSTDLGVKASMGYAKRSYSLGLIYLSQPIQITADNDDILRSGNLRFIATYRVKRKKFR